MPIDIIVADINTGFSLTILADEVLASIAHHSNNELIQNGLIYTPG